MLNGLQERQKTVLGDEVRSGDGTGMSVPKRALLKVSGGMSFGFGRDNDETQFGLTSLGDVEDCLFVLVNTLSMWLREYVHIMTHFKVSLVDWSRPSR